MAINDLMMKSPEKVAQHIIKWLSTYAENAGINGFVIGISGGIDSAVTSALCARTGINTIVVSMPIRQNKEQHKLSLEHINWLKLKFNVTGSLKQIVSFDVVKSTAKESGSLTNIVVSL